MVPRPGPRPRQAERAARRQRRVPAAIEGGPGSFLVQGRQCSAGQPWPGPAPRTTVVVEGGVALESGPGHLAGQVG